MLKMKPYFFQEIRFLICQSEGLTFLPEAEAALCASVRNKLYVLPDNVIVYPGHGPETDIAFEKKNNMYV